MQRKYEISYMFFVFTLYLVIFIDLFIEYFPILNYWDEMIAALSIPIWIFKGNIKRLSIDKKNYVFWVVIALIFAVAGNLIYRYQPLFKAVLPDLVLNLKFWLSIYVGQSLFCEIIIEKHGKKLARHIKCIINLFIILFILDRIFTLFPGDIRYGIKATWMFYEIHSYFTAICVFLLGMLTIVKEEMKHYTFYSTVLLLFMISTLRSKAFGGVILFIFLYYLVYKCNKKINIRTVILLAIPCFIVGWPQIQIYFFSSEERARGVLLETSILILKDHFPFGSGLSTFASHFSGVVYSPLYYKYGINRVYGLAKEHPSFISDTFWPMIFAQYGFWGTICYCLALLGLLKKIWKVQRVGKNIYLAILYVFMYLCISSIAESAFVHTMSVPFGMIIGLGFAQMQFRNNKIVEVTR